MPQLRTFVCSAAMTRRFRSSTIKSSVSLILPETKFRSRQENKEKSFNRFILTIFWLHEAHEQLCKPWMFSPSRNSFTAQAVCFVVLSECLFLANSVTSSSVRLAHRLSARSGGSNVGSSSQCGPGHPGSTLPQNTLQAHQTQLTDGWVGTQPGSTGCTPGHYSLLPPGTLHHKTWLNRQY